MNNMLLVLKRSAEKEASLQQLLKEQQDKSSPNFHRWLSPDEFGQQFGPSDEDVNTIVGWLKSHGFQAPEVARGRAAIKFSGTAAQVAQAFHTSIHKFVVDGEDWANSSDPQIPIALAPAVSGVASLHNFVAKSQIQRTTKLAAPLQRSAAGKPMFAMANGSHALSPADYATIYNISPLYQNNINGSGVTIAIVGRTNINVQDVVDFRNMFGLPYNPPQIILNGQNPGIVSRDDEEEAVLDVTWSGAVAPNAMIDLVVSGTTNTTDGVVLSELYIVDNNLAGIMSESFGACELTMGQSYAQEHNALALQAAAEGITYIVSAGDSGSAGCDQSQTIATHPASVNVLASSPYVVAVGGTEFNENGNNAAYWAADGSAKSFIPEKVWNDSCSIFECLSPNLSAGGGGASVFFTKPDWQAGVAGISSDGARDVPDVSLTSSAHDGYFICIHGSCEAGRGKVIGGTSAAAPSFAGIMALVNQDIGGREGQVNSVLYQMAAAENLDGCNGSNPNGLPGSNCVFNDVTIGTNAVPGEPGYGTLAAQYPAARGYDLATGLGSVNAFNLVMQWTGSSVRIPQTITLNPQFIPTQLVGTSLQLTNLASASSGLPLTFTGGNAYCSISGNTLSLNAVGMCFFTASQPGNAVYAPATLVGQIFFIGSAQIITSFAPIPSQTVNTSITLNATASSGLPVSFISNTPAVCTTVGNTAWFWTAGTCTIEAQQGGDLTRAAATPFLQTLRVFTASAMRFIPVVPCRVADSRSGPPLSAGMASSFTVSGTCGIPSTATAYSLNVTAVPSETLSFLSIWPTGQPQPNVSTLNSWDGRVKANAAIVDAGTGGSVNVYVSDKSHVVLDINGYFVPATDPSGLAFYPVTPCRIADTRRPSGAFGGPSMVAGEARSFTIPDSACNLPDTAGAYSLNFTVVPHSKLGYLSTWPTGQPQPYVSTLNALTGGVTSNAAIVPAGDSGAISVFVTDDADVVIDVNGYFGPQTNYGLSLYSLSPCRVFDSRGVDDKQPIFDTREVSVAGSGCSIPTTAQGIITNATVVPEQNLGYLSLWPDGDVQPYVSTLNAFDGSVTSNMAIIPMSNGSVDAYMTDPTHLILDVSGYFAP
jgi:hypothetical protein